MANPAEIPWSKERCALCVEILRAAPSYREGLAEIAAYLKRPVTPSALRMAFARYGFDAPVSYVGKPARTTDPAPRGAPVDALDYDRDDDTMPREPVDEQGAGGAGSVDGAPTSRPDIDEQIAKLVRLTKKSIGFESLCDALEMHPAAMRGLVATARDRGVRVEIDRDHVGIPPSYESTTNQDVAIAPARDGQSRTFAIVGDIHAGSKHHLGAQLRDFCDYAYHERGVRVFMQVGDLLDGIYKFSVWEQSHRGFDEQIEALADTLPQYPGAVWPFIIGNHDETLGDANGIEVGQAMVRAMSERGRKDLIYLGARGAYARLVAPGERRGLFVHLWHPRDKGNAYAKSYRLQKQIEKYAPGTKPDLLAAGHWHQQFYFKTRGVHAMSCGCWQGGGSSFGKSLGGQPEVGSWIVDYSMTSDGTIRSLRPEWRGYEERETFRDVALG